MRRAVLALLSLCSVWSATASTTTPKLIGGSGPIDRPTAHTVYWCFHEWSCATVDSFVADGTTASVLFIARNWDAAMPSSPMQIRLDNVAVMTSADYFASLTPAGAASGDINCSFAPTDLMLDYANLPPVNYFTQFSGGIGPEWIVDGSQIGYLGTGTYEDPFNPLAPITTGCMALGSGSGPEFVNAELQLTGLTPGESYVISYWWRSLDEASSGNQNCQPPNDDFELKVYGEELVCVPDLPAPYVHAVQTLNWSPGTGLWRFQAIVGNPGAGPARDLKLTVEDASPGIDVTTATAIFGKLDPSPSELHPVGPFEADLSAFVGGSLFLLFHFEYQDDCDQVDDLYYEYFGSADPARYPTGSPSATTALLLEQNIPNPFNPSTMIQFEVPADGAIRLDILDARGRLLRRLASGWYERGPHALPWNGRDDAGRTVAAGSYFYRLSAEGRTITRRMLLLK